MRRWPWATREISGKCCRRSGLRQVLWRERWGWAWEESGGDRLKGWVSPIELMRTDEPKTIRGRVYTKSTRRALANYLSWREQAWKPLPSDLSWVTWFETDHTQEYHCRLSKQARSFHWLWKQNQWRSCHFTKLRIALMTRMSSCRMS